MKARKSISLSENELWALRVILDAIDSLNTIPRSHIVALLKVQGIRTPDKFLARLRKSLGD